MWPNPQITADLVTFTEEILNGKLHVLCNVGLHRNISFWINNNKTKNFTKLQVVQIVNLVLPSLYEESLVNTIVNKGVLKILSTGIKLCIELAQYIAIETLYFSISQ